MLPQVFIASSSRSIQVAYDLQEILGEVCRCEVWKHGFSPSRGTLETLLEWLEKADFAIFVFGSDDTANIRNENVKVTRDNVVFECGLFSGRLGMERVFIFSPSTALEFQLPTDLLGITTLQYYEEGYTQQGSVGTEPSISELSALCNPIRKEIRSLGMRERDMLNDVEQACAICIDAENREEFRVLLVETTSNRWGFPKERISRQREHYRTAERAAFREAGYYTSASKQMVGVFHHRKSLDGDAFEVAAYKMFVSKNDELGTTRRRVVWATYAECKKYLSIDRDPDHFGEIMDIIERLQAEYLSA